MQAGQVRGPRGGPAEPARSVLGFTQARNQTQARRKWEQSLWNNLSDSVEQADVWETQKGRVSPSIGESRVGPEGRRVTGEQVLFHGSPKVGGTDASINQGLTLLFRNMLGSSSSEMLPAFWGPRTKLRRQWTFLLPSWSRNRTSWVAQMQGRIEHE